MIRIAICDDQQIHITRLVQLIRDVCARRIPEEYDCRICGTLDSAESVTEYLKQNTIDVLFLDIEMKGMNGFELAAVLNRECPGIIIIFVSAYENYVYSAFEYAPFRFLRKTHLEEELEPALVAAVDNLMSRNRSIELNTSEGRVETRLEDIIYFESEKNYVVTHLTDGRLYRSRGTVASVSEQLEGEDFFKIHKAFLINLAKIKRISGFTEVIMCSGEKLPVSSRTAAEFKKAYMEYTNRRFARY